MDLSHAVFTIIGANIVLMMTSIGITITLYLHTDKKIDEMKNEMKDFHGKLCVLFGPRPVVTPKEIIENETT